MNKWGFIFFTVIASILASLTLGCAQETNKEVSKNQLQIMIKLAEEGSSNDQYLLGYRYDSGVGIPEDDVAAAKWYLKAAERGHMAAQGRLGAMYDLGRGVPEDDAAAVKWYHKASEQGLMGAQFNLGQMYEKGEGVPADNVAAVKWYRQAAKQGDAQGQVALGVMYANGMGVARNSIKAYSWTSLSAAQDYDIAKQLKALLAKDMTREEITEAELLAATCLADDYKNCD